MSVTLEHPLQQYGTGDLYTGALTQFSGSIIEGYQDELVMARHVALHPITGGSTYQFPALANASGSDVDPGVDRTGANQPESEFRTVSLDPKEYQSDAWYALTEEFVTHYDVTAAYGRAFGAACARQVEDRLLRALIIGARIAARGSGDDLFPAGSSITSDTTTNATVIATNYPVSLSGSLALQGDLDKLAYTFDVANAPKDGRVAFLSYYLKRVLLQDKTLLSSDYQGVNDLITRRMVQCQGFWIEFTNRMPRETLAASQAAFPTAYQVASNAAGAYTVCLAIAGPDSVGQLTALGGVRPVNPMWVAWKNAYFMGAKVWQGAKWIRPETCGEIRLTG